MLTSLLPRVPLCPPRFMEAQIHDKEVLIEKLTLKNTTNKAAIAKLEAQLAHKEEMGEVRGRGRRRPFSKWLSQLDRQLPQTCSSITTSMSLSTTCSAVVLMPLCGAHLAAPTRSCTWLILSSSRSRTTSTLSALTARTGSCCS